MEGKLNKVVAVVAAPLLTVASTALVAKHVPGFDKSASDATGAALAGLAVFALTQGASSLPRRSRWWRRHFDSRAAFEGWWLQIHAQQDRAAVFSFLYSPNTNSYSVDGNAFNSKDDHLAHWMSTQVFFSSDRVSYLWEGKSFENHEWIQRQGTTNMWLTRTGGRAQPVTGGGEVLHLKQDRVLDFQLRRVTLQELRSLLSGDARLDDLGDVSEQKRLARAHLAREFADHSASSARTEGDVPTTMA